MDNIILILIKTITALYLNDSLPNKSSSTFDEIEEVVQSIKIEPRNTIGLGGEDSVVEALKYTVEWMLFNREGGYVKEDLIQRLSINMQSNHEYIQIAKSSLVDCEDLLLTEKRVNTILKELRFEKKKNKLQKMITVANAKINFSGESINTKMYVRELIGELTELDEGDSDITNLVAKIDFTDKNSIKNALEKGVERVLSEGKLNTGLVGLNDACGGDGIGRGECVNFGGLTHHYKTGILMDLALNIPRFNKPYMFDESKKPMILFITFENTIEQNVIELYQKIDELENQRTLPVSKINLAEAEHTIFEYYNSKGYNFQLLQIDPSNFSIYDMFHIMSDYISGGFELHACICDYLHLIAPQTFGERLDTKIQKSFELARNFCHPKGIAFITAHQLSTAADELAKTLKIGFTRTVCSGGWYMDCKSLYTKLDLEIVMYIHKHLDGSKYLMFSRGKHRGGKYTPESKLHFIYKFEEFGGIAPDVHLAESRALYALPKVIDSSESMEW